MKKMSIVIVLILSGCVSTPKPKAVVTSPVDISFPELKKEHRAFIGEPMLSQGFQYEVPTIEFKEPVEISYLDANYVISNDVVFEQYGFDKNADYFESKYAKNAITANYDYDYMQSNRFSIERSGKVCVILKRGAAFCDIKEKLNFTKSSTPRVHKNNFQQTLIYNGKSGSQISVGYREFSGDLARTAFSNEVTYDLSESKIIGYKGARIEIINATNQYIHYKVIKNFNK